MKIVRYNYHQTLNNWYQMKAKRIENRVKSSEPEPDPSCRGNIGIAPAVAIPVGDERVLDAAPAPVLEGAVPDPEVILGPTPEPEALPDAVPVAVPEASPESVADAIPEALAVLAPELAPDSVRASDVALGLDEPVIPAASEEAVVSAAAELASSDGVADSSESGSDDVGSGTASVALAAVDPATVEPPPDVVAISSGASLGTGLPSPTSQ
jgi:hypothetical protein